MKSITANELKVRGVSAVEEYLEDDDEVVVSVRGRDTYVVMRIEKYAGLREFELSAAGARVTGTGDFTFDNEKTEMFEGFPQPEGAVDLRIAGAMTLIDKLTQMGLVPQEEAMTTRMMLAMFAVPVEGEEDTMTSRFEIGEDGVPVVNGVPLQ